MADAKKKPSADKLRIAALHEAIDAVIVSAELCDTEDPFTVETLFHDINELKRVRDNG